MKLSNRLQGLLLGCSLLGVAVSTPSRDLDPRRTGAAAPDARHDAPATPKNLRVLPKDSSAADIKMLMDRYGEELGVSCDYCHVQDPQTQKVDYVSDDNPAKQTARVMIAMLDEINTKYLAQLADQKYAVPVSCGNCHQGQTDPPTFEPGARPAAGLRAGGG